MPRVTILGDSHMQGMLAPLTKRLEADGHTLALGLGCPGKEMAFYLGTITPGMINYAKDYGKCSFRDPGNLLAALPKTGIELLAASKPDVVIVQLGGNNFDMNASSYAAKAGKLVRAAQEAGAQRVVWLGPPTATANPEKAAKNDATARIQQDALRSLDVPWIDLRPYSKTGHRDGIHLSPTGYSTLVDAIMPSLRAAIGGIVQAEPVEVPPPAPAPVVSPPPVAPTPTMTPTVPPPAPVQPVVPQVVTLVQPVKAEESAEVVVPIQRPTEDMSPWVYVAAFSAAGVLAALVSRRR